MEELTKILDNINGFASSKEKLLSDIQNNGKFEEKYRKSFNEAYKEKVFLSTDLTKILIYFKHISYTEKYITVLQSCINDTTREIGKIDSNNMNERLFVELLSKIAISIIHIEKEVDFNIPQIELNEEELLTLFKFTLITPNEIIIDRVHHNVSKARNSVNILSEEYMKEILNIVTKYNILDRLYLDTLYQIHHTLNIQFEILYKRLINGVNSLSKKEKENANFLNIINNIKTNNTHLFALMESNPNEYKLLINHLKSDKDLNGKNKQIQIEEKTFANFKWIALESRNRHIQKVISILVLCSMKNWLSKKWSEISTVDKQNIIKNTFGLKIEHQNFHSDKIDKIESNILTINEKGIDYDRSLNYLSLLECFIKKGEFLQKLK